MGHETSSSSAATFQCPHAPGVEIRRDWAPWSSFSPSGVIGLYWRITVLEKDGPRLPILAQSENDARKYKAGFIHPLHPLGLINLTPRLSSVTKQLARQETPAC